MIKVLTFVLFVCSAGALVQVTRPVQDGCLTPTQKAELQADLSKINTIFTGTEYALKLAGMFVKDSKILNVIHIAEQVLDAVDNQLLGNLTKIIDESCGTCSQIAQAAKDAVDTIEATLDAADPAWRNNKVFVSVVSAIDSLLGLLQAVCPSTGQAYHGLVTKNDGNCSSAATLCDGLFPIWHVALHNQGKGDVFIETDFDGSSWLPCPQDTVKHEGDSRVAPNCKKLVVYGGLSTDLRLVDSKDGDFARSLDFNDFFGSFDKWSKRSLDLCVKEDPADSKKYLLQNCTGF